jgi:hypothetical protein
MSTTSNEPRITDITGCQVLNRKARVGPSTLKQTPEGLVRKIKAVLLRDKKGIGRMLVIGASTVARSTTGLQGFERASRATQA